MARTIDRTSIELQDALRSVTTAVQDTGQSITETVGGIWRGGEEEPTFIPLDQFISDSLLDKWQNGDLATDPSELILESELDG